MAQLLARPTGPLSSRFDVTQDGAQRAWVRYRMFRVNGETEIDGVAMVIRRVALLTWTVGDGPAEFARVERSGPLGLSWDLSWPGGRAQLRAPVFAFKADLVLGGEPVGSIRPKNLLSRALVIDAPEVIPLPALLLAIWVTIRRRRQASGAAAGG